MDFKISKNVEIDTEKHSITINNPEKNMQTDDACFEGIVLLLHIENPEIQIKLYFSTAMWNGTLVCENAEQRHFIRFLYRVLCFTSFNSWLVISGQEKQTVEQFAQMLNTAVLINNVPKGNADTISGNDKKEHFKEHILENKFVEDFENGTQYLSKLLVQLQNPGLNYLNHQMPNGLFIQGKVSKLTKIFPTGFFDLWGINDKQELCIFELKTVENEKLGIISELFFYAEYAAEFLSNYDFINKSDTSYRGYDKLLRWCETGEKKIHAYFLVPQDNVYTQIQRHKREIIDLLNKNNHNIIYDFIEYDPNNACIQ